VYKEGFGFFDYDMLFQIAYNLYLLSLIVTKGHRGTENGDVIDALFGTFAILQLFLQEYHPKIADVPKEQNPAFLVSDQQINLQYQLLTNNSKGSPEKIRKILEDYIFKESLGKIKYTPLQLEFIIAALDSEDWKAVILMIMVTHFENLPISKIIFTLPQLMDLSVMHEKGDTKGVFNKLKEIFSLYD
jgi:hypothetical protein